jgi:hypothetical protein
MAAPSAANADLKYAFNAALKRCSTQSENGYFGR